METKRLNKYAKEVCDAYKEVAGYKWGGEFECRNLECRGTKYFEGKKPYSRRCLNPECKKDDSPTANTAFDKLRIPLPIALGILKLIMNSNTWLKSSELTRYIEKTWEYKCRQQTVWDFLHRIYKAMPQEAINYDKEALYVTFFSKEKRVILSKGLSDGRIYYTAQSKKKIGDNIVRLVNEQTNAGTKVAVFDVGTPNLKNRIAKRKPFLITIKDRPSLFTDEKAKNVLHLTALEMAKDVWPWIAGDHLNLYAFKKNNNRYEDLMNLLIHDFGKVKGTAKS